MTSSEMLFVNYFRGFVVSEKSNMASTHYQIVMKVKPDINKAQIKETFESLFGVTVESVKTIVVKGKKKRFGRFSGKRSDWKKAYIAIKPDENGQNFMEKNNGTA